jgi:formate/nitrite transporter FocA (FNT family)
MNTIDPTTEHPHPSHQALFEDRLSKEVEDLSEVAGVRKVTTRPLTTFILSILAGAFIAFGAYFSLVVSTGSEHAWYGVFNF